MRNTLFHFCQLPSVNASKCQAMSITKKTKPWDFAYEVDGHRIETASDHKYLGVTINKGLDWKQHVQNITSSACSTLGILRRNISSCPMEIKSRAYKALVRPKLEYSSVAWKPYQNDHVNKLEGVQRQAARLSVTTMTEQPASLQCCKAWNGNPLLPGDFSTSAQCSTRSILAW